MATNKEAGVTCRCLCFGFLLHIMYTYFFFLLTALHPSQSLLTDVRTWNKGQLELCSDLQYGGALTFIPRIH
jgi:hypothetical protein